MLIALFNNSTAIVY